MAPGQEPASASFQMINMGDKAVEVVCMELDGQFLADEQALRAMDM